MPENDFLIAVAAELETAVRPLVDAFQNDHALSDLIRAHGWIVDHEATGILSGFRTSLGIIPSIDNLIRLISELSGADIAAYVRLAPQLYDACKGLVTGIEAATSLATRPPALAVPFGEPQFWSEFPVDLLGTLFTEYLSQRFPRLSAPLHLIGVIELRWRGDLTVPRLPYLQRRIRWQRLAGLLNPSAALRDVYGWGTAGFDAEILLGNIERTAHAFGLAVDTAGPADATPHRLEQLFCPILFPENESDPPFAFGVNVSELRSTAMGGSDAGLLLEPRLDLMEGGDAPNAVRLRGAPIALSPRIEFRPTGLRFMMGDLSEPLESELTINLSRLWSPQEARLVIGSEASHRLELSDVLLGFRIKGAAATPEVSFSVGAHVLGVIDFSTSDGFLRSLFGSDPQRVESDLRVEWSSRGTVTFQGQGGLRLVLSINRSFGPVRIESIVVDLNSSNRGLNAALGVNGSIAIGPVVVSIDGIGVEIQLTPLRSNQPRGALGDLDITFGLRPPSGLGIQISAGPVHGGGFVNFDEPQGRYFGVLHLHVFTVTVNAVMLLETRLPGGTPAYSFLLLITAEFPSIQLGMGFTLNGLGGMAGLHRSIAAEPFRSSLREGSVSRLLFPSDPVRNAPRLLQDLQRFMPATADRYLFGPVAKIGYGTPTIVEAQIGIVLELPEPFRIVLLGVLRAAFPNREHPVVRINLDALGVLDLGARTFSLDASLYDSRIVAFDLSGDMALRLAWGDAPMFALAVGGFNPHFTPPPAFPTLRRLTLALGSGANPRLALEAYFALTSNTLQFGARAQLHAEAAGFSLDGELSFDALIIFDPFGFRIDVAAALALRGLGMTLAAVRIEATLEGPRPWHITGQARVTILFLDVQVNFDARFGEEERLPAPPQIDPWSVLRPELVKVENWVAELPAATPVVSFGQRPGNAEQLVDPVGGLSLRQRAVPLGRRISKIGEQRLAIPQAIMVSELRVGSERFADRELEAVMAPFAAGQYEDLAAAEKLSRPSFEPMQAGVRVTSRGVTCGRGVGVTLTYETVVPGAEAAVTSYAPTLSAQLATLGYAAAATGTVRRAGMGAYAPAPGQSPGVSLAEESYVIVSTETLMRTTITSPGAHGTVAASLEEHLRANPSARGKLAVMPEHELEAA